MRINVKTAAGALCLLLSSFAHAGPYSDGLARCLVEATTTTDRMVFVRWITVSFSAHPAVNGMIRVAPADVEKSNKEFGALFTRLMTETCRKQTQDVAKYEGVAAVQQSFQFFGQAAATDLFSNPAVVQAMSKANQYMDQKKMESLFGTPSATPRK